MIKITVGDGRVWVELVTALAGAGQRRDAAPVVSREPLHVTVAVTGPGRT